MSRSVRAVCACPAGALLPGHTRSPPVSFEIEATFTCSSAQGGTP